jgi:hypothetical protein
MKAMLLVIALFAISSYARIIDVSCSVGEDTLVVTTTVSDMGNSQMAYLFGPGGLGPDYLIESYVANYSQVIVTGENLSVFSTLPHGGRVSILSRPNNGPENVNVGKIVFPVSKVEADLSNCVHQLVK